MMKLSRYVVSVHTLWGRGAQWSVIVAGYKHVLCKSADAVLCMLIDWSLSLGLV
jgi:hypothetical protein